ncbi:MAG: response regulator [Candidatus Sericytochromatia bacterium]|nr:response regulator [Candidatus Sericytochromatia bacterium]
MTTEHHQHPDGDHQQVLAGGGEMGALMRTIDWGLTPLGPVATWPQSLRTTVSLCLSSTFPILITWGPERVQIYNDLYRPICGEKHPRSMGQRFNECWASALPVVGGIVDRAQAGQGSYIEDQRMFLDRHGYLEGAFMTFSFSPIRDESGGVGGLFHPITETTDKMLSARRTEVLRDLAVRLGDAKSMVQIGERLTEAYVTYELDIPFLLFYEFEPDARRVRLLGTAGLPAGTAASRPNPAYTPVAESACLHALEGEQTRHLNDVAALFDGLTSGPYPEVPQEALLLPIRPPGDAEPVGCLVAGVSRRRILDAGYRAFYEQLRATVTAAVANVHAYQHEQARMVALAELYRAKTTFLSNVSHEFRTPLTLILGPVEEALAEPHLSLSGESLKLVRRNTLRLQKLVNTLLDFSRIEAGRVNAHYQPTDLSAVTADLASAFRSLVETAGLTFTVACPPLAEAVYVDRDLYEKVVLNLLSNAFKFTLAGGISVALAACNEYVQLTVSDTGVGIAEAELPHIFERFHRIQGAKGRSFEGSGIGLALVQELVKLHGGTITVESRLGEGTCFTASFRLGRAHLAPEHVNAAATLAVTTLAVPEFLSEAANWVHEAPEIADHALRFGHILLADDNADMRAYVSKLLTARGWAVETVCDGQAALDAARARRPDLVLTDVMMPGLDGFGLLEALKADERTCTVPVILLSARAGEAASVEALQKGADDYLVKPFAATELVSRVSARLVIARAQAESLAHEQAIGKEAVVARQELHSLFMQAPVALAILEGPRHTYTFANPRHSLLIGGRDVMGKALLEALPELKDQGIEELMDSVVATGESFIGSEFLVNVDRKGLGLAEEVYYNVIYSPKRNGRGEVDGVFACATDVTDQVIARRQTEAILVDLKIADQRKDEFLATLAHELRNPMAAISMAISLLELVPGDTAQAARHRETARRQMGTLVRLVDDLLDVSRITRGQVALQLEMVDLASIVQNALTDSRATIEAREHTLSVTVAAGAFPAQADATRLEQVLINLLTNAAKYTEPGGTITVRLARDVVDGTAQAVLSVSDTGRGIPEDRLKTVFDLFVQVSPTIDRAMGGLGLGLTLVKSLVEMHGGSVSAHSDGPGNGSEFIVRLPLAKAAQPAFCTAIPALPRPAVARTQRILLVEDMVDVSDALKALLEYLGHEVTVASDGLEGAARILAMRPDLALVDIGLPGIDGYEVARRVRETPGGETLYLVALTGYGGPDVKAKAKAAGFDLHITKPVDIAKLTQAVDRGKPVRN